MPLNHEGMHDDDLTAEVSRLLAERGIPHSIYTVADIKQAIADHAIWRDSTPQEVDTLVTAILRSPEWSALDVAERLNRQVEIKIMLAEHGPRALNERRGQ